MSVLVTITHTAPGDGARMQVHQLNVGVGRQSGNRVVAELSEGQSADVEIDKDHQLMISYVPAPTAGTGGAG